jgi:hypothetical protein
MHANGAFRSAGCGLKMRPLSSSLSSLFAHFLV